EGRELRLRGASVAALGLARLGRLAVAERADARADELLLRLELAPERAARRAGGEVLLDLGDPRVGDGVRVGLQPHGPAVEGPLDEVAHEITGAGLGHGFDILDRVRGGTWTSGFSALDARTCDRKFLALRPS